MPKLAKGVTLEGVYEDSGYKDPPLIVRRGDGQLVQLPPLLYVVAEEANGERSYEELAERVGERIKRKLAPADVELLVESKLRPLGVLAQADGSSPELPKADPLLALRFRVTLLGARGVRALARVFGPLFFAPVVVTVLAALVAVDVWLFGYHGVAQSTRTLLYHPLYMLLLLGLVVVGTGWHELGHASALRYGGGTPGKMGAGIYVVWPAFYTDVTDAYSLGRGGRIRTDLGGVYFNAIFVLGVVGAYWLTNLEPLLLAVLVIHLQVFQQFLPFLRLDGYYVVSDLTGVPDLFARIKPTLKNLVPGKEAEPEVEQLKPWVRRATTAWVLTAVPVIAFVFAMIVFNAPRVFATGWDSFWLHGSDLRAAWHRGQLSTAAVSGVQALFLLMPLTGTTYSLSRAGWRLSSGAWSWSAGSSVRRTAVIAVCAALAVGGAYVLLPNGDYRPIQPGERGTLGGGIAELRAAPSGRPSLTSSRERQLGSIVEQRDLPANQRNLGSPTRASVETADTGTSSDNTTTTTETTETVTTQTTETTATTTTATATTETSPTETTTTSGDGVQ